MEPAPNSPIDELPDAVLHEILAQLNARSLAWAAGAARFLRAAAPPAAHQRVRALGMESDPVDGNWAAALRHAEAVRALGRATVAASSTFSLFVQDGALYASGCDPNLKGDLTALGGVDSAPSDAEEPLKLWQPVQVLTIKERVIEVAAGSAHSLALVDTGAVFSFGSNRFGQLGRSVDRETSQPHRVIALVEQRVHARSVAAGAFFSHVVSDDGRLFSWGSNTYGELGVPRKSNQTRWLADDDGEPMMYDDAMVRMHDAPREVATPLDARVHAAAGGRTHSLLLSRRGGVLAAGRNKHGQLGHGDLVLKCSFSFTTVEALSHGRATQVACGNNHSLAVMDNGILFAWGCNEGFQLGARRSSNNANRDMAVPRAVYLLSRVRCVAAGFAHTIAVTDDGAVFVAGDSGLRNESLRQTTTHFSECSSRWPSRATAGGGPMRVCAGARHSFVYAAPADADAAEGVEVASEASSIAKSGVPNRTIVAFGLAGHGQLGSTSLALLATSVMVSLPQPVQLPVRTRRPFRPPIKAGSELERRYYGQMKKSLSHLPRDDQLRILVSLGPAHAWRLPPGHTSQL